MSRCYVSHAKVECGGVGGEVRSVGKHKTSNQCDLHENNRSDLKSDSNSARRG